MRGVLLLLTLTTALAVGAAVPTIAQQLAPGGVQRDCQTVRTCNFARNGVFRGCLSSYTCRTCRLVQARCAVGSTRANCREMVCAWGG